MSNEMIKRVAEAIKEATDNSPFVLGVYPNMPNIYSVLDKRTNTKIIDECTHNAAEDAIEKLNYEYVAQKAIEVLEKPEWWIKKEK